MTLAVIGLAVLAVAALIFVAFPLARPPAASEVVPEPTEEARARLASRERRDTAYAALRELELDHRTGKLTDEDYAASRDALRAEAMEALHQLERLEADAGPEP
jgi:hypothetical protein